MKSILKPFPPINSMDQPVTLPDDTEDVSLAAVPAKTFRIAPCSTVLVFERADPTMCIRMQVPAQEALIDGDVRNTFAASAVDVMLGVATRGGAQCVELYGPSHLDAILARYHAVSGGEDMTVRELKDLMTHQLTDLALRCVARMYDLEEKPEFNLKHRRAEMAQDHESISLEDEAQFAEDLINRKPDVLTQRYMRRRVDGKTIGYDVNRALARAIKVVLSAPLLFK